MAVWAALWADALDVEVRTEENYLSRIRNHIEPRWGSTAPGDVTALAVTLWIRHERTLRISLPVVLEPPA
ncbi:hypothetical protein SAMN05421837_11051 [Amycolatopsis pretoriensis]|uniref:Uncharacterized protein n=1 Tax=Amycolatopsis pretoriensis TaxID=218821 RepID=A0A1H5RD71_9PSEU|nr:hypothetical protein SAMN05421837_11051 [Amycolatopsis pretoriensis]